MAQDIAAIVAAVIAAMGEAPAAAAVAPVAPRIASPFTAAAAGGAQSVVAAAAALFPRDTGAQRAQIALSLAPRFTCSVDTTATLGDGSEVPTALHGFTTAKVSGEPCPGIRGIAKGEACPGTIR